jgi:hypothetical protein
MNEVKAPFLILFAGLYFLINLTNTRHNKNKIKNVKLKLKPTVEF